MRHRVYGKHLSRDKNERTALFKNLIQSLILAEQIQTTEAKAKAIKGLVDKLVNQAKTKQATKLFDQFSNQKKIGEKLIKEIAPRFTDRSSGYTSIVRLGKRLGDGAMLVKMSFVEGKKVASGKSQESSKTEEKVVKKDEGEKKAIK